MEYKPNDLDFVQRFAGYAHSIDRMKKKDLDIIAANAPFVAENLAQRHAPKIRLHK